MKKLLEADSEGLPVETKNKIFSAFDNDKITFENLQACLDKINKLQGR
jgi:hypothetical protein|tara:strand:+ start:697 stop:840 length:144 start_codon:yes stop_codon:yes gene_type:complete